MSTRVTNIGVVIEMNARSCSLIYRGIAQYALRKPRWRLHRFSPQWYGERWTPPLPTGMDGYIGHIDNHRNFDELQTMYCPVVTTSDTYDLKRRVPFHEVTFDREAVGRQLAEHTAATGARRAAVLWAGPAEDRRTGPPLRNALVQLGLEVQSHHLPPGDPVRANPVAKVLKRLPEGTVVIALDEGLAEIVAETCRIEGLEVPGRLMLLSASPDGLLCDASSPTISYVRFPFVQVGYEAARLMDRVLEHPPAERVCLRVPQGPVAQRESTALRVSRDAAVDAVLRWIALNAHRPVAVADAVAAAPLQRRAIERRFAATVGCSVRKAIEEAHLRRAKELLETTDLTVTDIAARSGFGGPSRFCATFRKAEGVTPAAYRQRVTSVTLRVTKTN